MLKKLLFISAFLFWPGTALAAPDLSIGPADISFSYPKPLANQDFRIYATVRNSGQQDARAMVRFFIDNNQIGSDQPLTVAVGKPTTVFVDWQASEGYYRLAAEIINIDPPDGDTGNNRAEIKDFLINKDTDGDGKPDTEDLDDDNDGITDGVETINGSDPLRPDTDGDGVNDKDDAFPLDKNKWLPEPAPPKIEPEPAVESAPTARIKAPAAPAKSAPTKSEPPREFTREEVTYTFPDKAQAEYELGVEIAKSRLKWQEWQFEALGVPDSFIYLWDFGDGKLAEGKEPIHAFPGAGQYKVTLSASDNAGGIGTAETLISIGFWNLANPWLQAVLGVLGLLLIGLTIVAVGNFLPANLQIFYKFTNKDD